MPAHCFDTSLSDYQPFTKPPFTPDTYRGYPGAINAAVRNRIVNFFNENDFALATGKVLGGTVEANWEANQLKYKPDTKLGYRTDGVTSSQYNVSFSEPRQIMSFVSRPLSQAVGAKSGVAGVIYFPNEVDLTTRFNFLGGIDEHSAQFNWDIQRAAGFYVSLLQTLFPRPQP